MSTRYPSEPANPSPLEVVNSATFGPAVRRAFHDMGRVDVTPYAIPWSGIDVPMVTDLPQSPNDRAEVNLIADSANGVVWRLVYLRSTDKWHFIGGGALASDSAAADTVSGAHVAFDPDLAVSVPLAGTYDVNFAHFTFQTGGGISSVLVHYDGANDTSWNYCLYAGASGASLGSQHRITLAAPGTIQMVWGTTAFTGESQNRALRVIPVAVSA